MKLKALFLNCTLKKSPAVSNTQVLIDKVAALAHPTSIIGSDAFPFVMKSDGSYVQAWDTPYDAVNGHPRGAGTHALDQKSGTALETDGSPGLQYGLKCITTSCGAIGDAGNDVMTARPELPTSLANGRTHDRLQLEIESHD